MTATDVLRRLLDERGVEYETYVEQPTGFEHVKWNFSEHGSADFNVEFGSPWLTMYGVISGPEQAIAATLGSCNCSNNCTDGERTETCHVESSIIDTYEYNRWEYELSCGHTIIWEDSEPPNFCPDCGRRIVDEKEDA